MTAVLLSSSKPGLTGWFSTRRGNVLEIHGMQEGDDLQVNFRPESEAMSVDEDGFLLLPPGADYVQVEHVAVSGSAVHVDIAQRE